MLWFKAFHVIAMVAWFAGLFYLPRLFVYHAQSTDEVSLVRFMMMERRLYYGIMWPAAIVTIVLGLGLLWFIPFYASQGWMHIKFLLVFLLMGYHIGCGYYMKQFSRRKNQKSALFFRVFNEIPTLFLITIVCLVMIKP